MLGQRCIILCLLQDGVLPNDISDRLNGVYRVDAMKKLQVFLWIQKGRREREDLPDAQRPGRPPRENFDTILAHKLEMNPHATAWQLALSLRIFPQTVTAHLREGLGMRCYHFQWIPHLLDEFRQTERVRRAYLMLKALDDHARTNCQYCLIADESRMMYDQIPSKMWTLDRDHSDPILHPNHDVRKTIVTVFCGPSGIGKPASSAKAATVDDLR
jgi:hypothetical protein